MEAKSDQGTLRLTEGGVKDEWIDEYGHMNMSRYVEVCDFSTYAFWEFVNAPRDMAGRGGAEYAVVETHVNYLSELRRGDLFYITTQLLGADAKRFRLFHMLYHHDTEELVATNEVMALGFSLEARGLMPFVEAARDRLEEVLKEHQKLPPPRNAGRSIAMPKRS